MLLQGILALASSQLGVTQGPQLQHHLQRQLDAARVP